MWFAPCLKMELIPGKFSVYERRRTVLSRVPPLDMCVPEVHIFSGDNMGFW